MIKRILPLAVLLLLSLSAHAETLVVWFSATGNTEALAAAAVEALGADQWQIVPETAYTEADLNYNSDCRANREQNDDTCRPAFVGTADPEAYDTILIAYPIWWGEEPRIIDTWLESVDLSDKRAAAMCTSGSSGIQVSYEHLQALAPDAEWLGAKRFPNGTTAEEMAEWCESIGIKKEEGMNMQITVGEHTLNVRLADNESAAALCALLADGPLTIPASNYGGFEKVCPLGTELPCADVTTETQRGDVMLYNGSNIVIFHGTNRWEYTRLGRIEDTADLAAILSGDETEITLSIQ